MAMSLNLVPVDNFEVYYSSAAVKKRAFPSAIKPARVSLREVALVYARSYFQPKE
jgi:hypothetical protein